MLLLLQVPSIRNVGVGGNHHNFLAPLLSLLSTEYSGVNMTELLTVAHSSMAMRPKPAMVAKLGYSTVHNV
jgi:hypothetical protein